jgi:hypothetical protein
MKKRQGKASEETAESSAGHFAHAVWDIVEMELSKWNACIRSATKDVSRLFLLLPRSLTTSPVYRARTSASGDPKYDWEPCYIIRRCLGTKIVLVDPPYRIPQPELIFQERVDLPRKSPELQWNTDKHTFVPK